MVNKYEGSYLKKKKKTLQGLYFLRLLRKSSQENKLLEIFYQSTIDSVLGYCISVWYSSCSMVDKGAPQRVVHTAQKIVGCKFLFLAIIYQSHCLCRAERRENDFSGPGHHLFKLMPSCSHFRNIKVRPNRFRDSFFFK